MSKEKNIDLFNPPDLISIFNKEIVKRTEKNTNNIDNSSNKDINKKEIQKDSIDEDLNKISTIYKDTDKILNTFLKDIEINPTNITNNLNPKDMNNENKDKSLKTGKDDDKDIFKIDVKYFKKDKKNKLSWFKGIAWMEELKYELQKDFIKPLKLMFDIKKIEKKKTKNKKDKEILDLFNQYKQLKVNIPTGFLMYWPPWTWKTFITKKLAEELEANYISQTMWDLWSSYQHQTTQNIKSLFEQSKKVSNKWPTILFLDEIDSLVSARTDRVDANKAEEISQFLQEFNKLAEEAPNLIVIAATNRPDHLDTALLRSGRFDKKIYVWPPTFETRRKMFELFINKEDRPNDWKINFKKLAELTDNYVNADIENIVKEASRSIWENIINMIQSKMNNNIDNKQNINNILTVLKQKNIEQAIKDIPSSIAIMDLSIYDEWNTKMNNLK